MLCVQVHACWRARQQATNCESLKSYWIDNPGFLTWGNYRYAASYLPLGVPNECVIHATKKVVSDAVAGDFEALKKQEVSRQQLYF